MSRQREEQREAKRVKVKQEKASLSADDVTATEVVNLTDELPPARAFEETDETKACPCCAHPVLINAEAVACGIAVCLSCDAEFCWKCKKVRADGRHLRCRCA